VRELLEGESRVPHRLPARRGGPWCAPVPTSRRYSASSMPRTP